MSLDEPAQIDGNWLVIVTLIAIWTSMTVLARRDLVKVSVRAQRIAVTLAVGVTAAATMWPQGFQRQNVQARRKSTASSITPRKCLWYS